MDGTPEPIESKEIDSWDARAYLRKRIPQSQYSRRAFDRGWYRNILFYLGIQWIRYNRSAQSWRPIDLPGWFPRQITNKYAADIDLMKSVFMQSDPQSIFSPASAEAGDIATARAAMDISKCIDLEVGQSGMETDTAAWLALTGNAFIIDGYDNDAKHGTKFIPDMMCLDCVRHIPAQDGGNGCPFCGGSNLIEAKDGEGQQMGQEVPIGRQFSEVASPFEIHCDLVAKNLDQSPFVYRAKTYPIEILKDMFPKFADKIKPDDAGVDSGMFYQTALSYVTNGTGGSPGNYSGSTGGVDGVPRGTLYHLHVRPTKKLPNGAEALICGDATLWKSEATVHDEEGKPIIPITQIGFNSVPGRLFAKTPADDLTYKQVQRNKIESFIQLAMERTSNPTWLLPKGIGIDNITGEPGEKIWYSAILNGMKPERIGGSELPGSVFRWLDSIDADMQDMSHTREIFRGETPKGVPTFGGAQLLLERGYAGFADGLKSWGRGWNNVRRNRLLIFREYASDERTMMVLGENREWEAKKFTKDSMNGKINVYLEEGTIAPKSKGYEQYMTSQLIQQQMLDMSDPTVKARVMALFDAGDLVEGLNIDIKDAIKEKEEFLKTGQPRPRQGIDNDQIHSLEHTKTAKSDEYKHWNPQMQQIWLQHIAWHNNNVKQAQKEAMQNDVHYLNAQAKKEQVALEMAAFAKQEDMKLEHQKARSAINLQAHGAKKAFDMATMHPKPNGGPA